MHECSRLYMWHDDRPDYVLALSALLFWEAELICMLRRAAGAPGQTVKQREWLPKTAAMPHPVDSTQAMTVGTWKHRSSPVVDSTKEAWTWEELGITEEIARGRTGQGLL